jgi:hypothetical protein
VEMRRDASAAWDTGKGERGAPGPPPTRARSRWTA